MIIKLSDLSKRKGKYDIYSSIMYNAVIFNILFW